MTDPERTAIADALLMVIFSLRENDAEAGHAWVLSTMVHGLSRAILVEVGARGEAGPVIQVAMQQVETVVHAIQSQFIRDRLTVVKH